MAPRDPTKGDFGAWVIRQREALGLSREELAVELYRYVPSIGKLSVSTIGTLEESLKSLDREIRQALEQFFHSRLHAATPSLDQLRGDDTLALSQRLEADAVSSYCHYCGTPIPMSADGRCPNPLCRRIEPNT
jgi:transcriptional regulator with XRE-family HTH domain